MRIDSDKKIAAKVQAYKKQLEHLHSQFYEVETAATNIKLRALQGEWFLVTATCPGGVNCVCRLNPLYQSLFLDQICPLVEEVNTKRVLESINILGLLIIMSVMA